MTFGSDTRAWSTGPALPQLLLIVTSKLNHIKSYSSVTKTVLWKKTPIAHEVNKEKVVQRCVSGDVSSIKHRASRAAVHLHNGGAVPTKCTGKGGLNLGALFKKSKDLGLWMTQARSVTLGPLWTQDCCDLLPYSWPPKALQALYTSGHGTE